MGICTFDGLSSVAKNARIVFIVSMEGLVRGTPYDREPSLYWPLFN